MAPSSQPWSPIRRQTENRAAHWTSTTTVTSERDTADGRLSQRSFRAHATEYTPGRERPQPPRAGAASSSASRTPCSRLRWRSLRRPAGRALAAALFALAAWPLLLVPLPAVPGPAQSRGHGAHRRASRPLSRSSPSTASSNRTALLTLWFCAGGRPRPLRRRARLHGPGPGRERARAPAVRASLRRPPRRAGGDALRLAPGAQLQRLDGVSELHVRLRALADPA